MSPPITLTPFAQPPRTTLSPPGSKSLTNRALVLAALAGGESMLSNVLAADDTAVMLDGLRHLGFAIEHDGVARTVRVGGRGGVVPASSADLFCGNSGTTIRFLAAVASLGHGTFTLDGVARMRQRPIGSLVTMLKNLGGGVAFAKADGFPPIRVAADGLPGGTVRYRTESSSQFLSAVLMVAPYARHEVRVNLAGPQTSWPYIEMTMRQMDAFGVTPELVRDPGTHEPKQIIVPRDVYRPTDYAIEPDASNATYFLAIAAIRPGAEITVRGLGTHGLQGDVKFADVLRQMGANVTVDNDAIIVAGTNTLRGVDVDLEAMPDTAQTLAVAALFASGPTTIRGLRTLRVKETDRLAALQAELTKLGATATIGRDESLTIVPPPGNVLTPAAIETYDDHRMAMSFAIAGTRAMGVTINDPACVNKTYPRFFEDLASLIA